MARNRFVGVESDTLQLSDGDWVLVRRRLNTGESREMLARTYQNTPGGPGLQLDIKQVGLSRVVAYVIDWSFVDALGNKVPYSEQALSGLEPESFKEILDAVDAHVEQQEKAREARKNAPAGENTSSPISPSAAS